MDFKKLKNEKGITLIALSVTIVVLLILAGVTISSVFSENGIIERAKKAQEAINESQKNDLAELEKLAEQMEKYTSSNDVAGVDLSGYVTLNLQSYVGRYSRQKCDYMQMYVEISDADNSEDKITYAIGTDWKENVIKEGDDATKLFIKDHSELEMIRVKEHDYEYSSNNNTMSLTLVNGFTDVKVSNLYIKKDKSYNVKISITSAYKNDNGVNKRVIDIYENKLENLENINTIILKKADLRNLSKIYDATGDGSTDSSDSDRVSQILSGIDSNEIISYSMACSESSSSTHTQKCLVLIDDYGNIINDEASQYVGFDYNRDGCINYIDSKFAKLIMGGAYF